MNVELTKITKEFVIWKIKIPKEHFLAEPKLYNKRLKIRKQIVNKLNEGDYVFDEWGSDENRFIIKQEFRDYPIKVQIVQSEIEEVADKILNPKIYEILQLSIFKNKDAWNKKYNYRGQLFIKDHDGFSREIKITYDQALELVNANRVTEDGEYYD